MRTRASPTYDDPVPRSAQRLYEDLISYYHALCNIHVHILTRYTDPVIMFGAAGIPNTKAINYVHMHGIRGLLYRIGTAYV